MSLVTVPPERSRSAIGLTALAVGGVLLGAALTRRPRRRVSHPQRAAESAASGARRGSAMLAASVLTDSLVEHYRGGFHHPEMFLAPTVAGATLAAATTPALGRPLRQTVFTAATLTGIAGHLYHLRNVAKRPGAPSWESLFYAAPLGAPGALLLAGRAGLAAMRLEDARPNGPTARRLGRRLTLGAALGLLGTTSEVALLHFRGAFHNPVMYVPLILPPVTALATADAVRDPTEEPVRRARILLRATAVMGLAGALFHAWGLHRNMGGWGNWRQNLQVAPPIPAPPSFTGVAIAGLGALDLIEAEGEEA